jgi:hypothetical protein
MLEFAAVAFAGDFARGVFDVLTALAGVEGGAAVAGGEVVGDLVRIGAADLAVVGLGEARDEFAGAVGGDLVVVVAGSQGVSMWIERGLGRGSVYHSKSSRVQEQFLAMLWRCLMLGPL